MKILKITNLKTGQVQQSDFQTQEECLAHFEKYKAVGFWGKEEHSIVHPSYVINHPEVLEVVGQEAAAEIPATYDANGVETSPFVPAKEFIQAVPYQAAYEEIVPEVIEVIPCEYTMEIIDNSLVEAREAIIQQIASLEAQITPRRVREALLSGDHTFIQNIEAQISALRGTLV